MARVLEHDGKEILKKNEIQIPRGTAVSNPEEAKQAAVRIGFPVILKALVPAGKRGKAGAIKLVHNIYEVYKEAEKLFNMEVSHFPVEQILVEQGVAIKKELYLSIAIDKIERKPVVIASSEGGVDIEEISRKNPGKVKKVHIDPWSSFPSYKGVEIWSDLGFKGKVLRQAAALTTRLFNTFKKHDATLLEVNPLVMSEDDVLVAVDVVLSVDESAIYRQPELKNIHPASERAWRPLTELERHMVAINEEDPYRGTARYTEFDGGDIGFMCGGGGASLLLMDALIKSGGRPANYSEVGGNPPENKVYGLCKGIISKEGVRGLFLAHNITSNTQINVVARGVTRALHNMDINVSVFPVVVREAGTHDAEGKKIFEEAGIEYHGDDITLTQAAQLMADKMRQVYPDYDQWGDN